MVFSKNLQNFWTEYIIIFNLYNDKFLIYFLLLFIR